MRIVLFSHSLVSDWSHGNAHFLRGLLRALQDRGHEVIGCERWRNWATDQLMQDHGHGPIVEFARRFGNLPIGIYGDGARQAPDIERLTRDADLVLVHEFNDPEVVNTLGQLRRQRDFLLLFHDTHHRAVTVPEQIKRVDLDLFDGVLAFGDSLTAVYRTQYGCERVWTRLLKDDPVAGFHMPHAVLPVEVLPGGCDSHPHGRTDTQMASRDQPPAERADCAEIRR